MQYREKQKTRPWNRDEFARVTTLIPHKNVRHLIQRTNIRVPFLTGESPSKPTKNFSFASRGWSSEWPWTLAFSNMPTLWGTRSKLTLPVLDFCFSYYLKIRLSLNISSVNISFGKFSTPCPRSKWTEAAKWCRFWISQNPANTSVI